MVNHDYVSVSERLGVKVVARARVWTWARYAAGILCVYGCVWLVMAVAVK